jgi:hypothetical protein
MDFDQTQDIDIILHLHLPKCAGTSLRKSIFQSLSENVCVEWNSTNPYDFEISIGEFAATLARHPNARLVSGHFPYGVHTILDGKTYKYITILRNPIDRILSQFRHTVMQNLYLLPAEEAELIVNSGFDAYVRSKYAEITFINTQARLLSGLVSSEKLYSVSLPDFLSKCQDIISKDFVHVGIQSKLSASLGYLSNFLSLPPDQVLIENNSNARGNTDCRTILPQRDIDYFALANSYDWALINMLFGEDASSLKSCCEDSLAKQEFFNSTVRSSALNLARRLRAIKNQRN